MDGIVGPQTWAALLPPPPKPVTVTVADSVVLGGAVTLQAFLTAHPRNTPAGVIELTLQHLPHNQFGTDGLAAYVNAGNWAAPVPAGTTVWYWRQETVYQTTLLQKVKAALARH